MKSSTKGYNSFSGIDIKAVFASKVIEELQGIPTKNSFIRIKETYKQKYPDRKKYHTEEAWNYCCPVKVITEGKYFRWGQHLTTMKPTIFSSGKLKLLVGPNDERMEIVAMTEKFEKRMPKVGEFIRLTEEYKKKYPQTEKNYSEYVWKYNGLVQVLQITPWKSCKEMFDIVTQPSIWESSYLTTCEEYDEIEVLVSNDLQQKVEITLIPNNSINCSCQTPSLKENWANWRRFFICTICKKEKNIIS